MCVCNRVCPIAKESIGTKLSREKKRKYYFCMQKKTFINHVISVSE